MAVASHFVLLDTGWKRMLNGGAAMQAPWWNISCQSMEVCADFAVCVGDHVWHVWHIVELQVTSKAIYQQ